MRLSKDDILRKDDILTEEVDVPEWGGTLLVRGMTGRQRDQWEASMQKRQGKRFVMDVADIRAKLVAFCVVGDDGQRIFTDADVDDLSAKSAAALDRIYTVAAKLSGVTDEDVEELVGNFGETPSAGTVSSSRNGSAALSVSSLPQQTPAS